MNRQVGEDGHFGADIADAYDRSVAALSTPEAVDPVVDFLDSQAWDRRALELGIGTGRIALPLASRGIEVHGIELSKAMASKLREKVHGDAIEVTIGDFSTTSARGAFSVVYLVFNTIMNLTTQEAQTQCFRNVSANLKPHGTFVVEVGVPGLQRLAPGQLLQDFRVDDSVWGIDKYDVVTQSLESHYFRFADDGGVRHSFAPFRYVWPSELDLMAQLAGLQLRERWADWKRAPFTAESRSHVSVWERLG
jgi:SAM-dependent methyltransferase